MGPPSRRGGWQGHPSEKSPPLVPASLSGDNPPPPGPAPLPTPCEDGTAGAGTGKLQRDERSRAGEFGWLPGKVSGPRLSRKGAGEEGVTQSFRGAAIVFWLIFIL